jgi:hypothetical protein
VTDYIDESQKTKENDLLFRISFKQSGIDYDKLVVALETLKSIYGKC